MFSYNDWAVIGNIGTVSNVMMLTLIIVMAMVMRVVMMEMMVMVLMMRQVMSKCHECEFLRNSFHHNGAAHGLRYTGRFALMISNIIITIILTTPIKPSVTFFKVTEFRIVKCNSYCQRHHQIGQHRVELLRGAMFGQDSK